MERKSFVFNNINYEVIATYHDDQTNKDYILYTDKLLDKNNKLNIYSALYNEKESNIELSSINTNEDKKIAYELISQIIKDLK